VRSVTGGSGNDGVRNGMLFAIACPPRGDGIGRRKLSGSGFTRPGVVEIVNGLGQLLVDLNEDLPDLEPGPTMSSQDSRRKESMTGEKSGMSLSCLMYTSPPTGVRPVLIRIFKSGERHELAPTGNPDPLEPNECWPFVASGDSVSSGLNASLSPERVNSRLSPSSLRNADVGDDDMETLPELSSIIIVLSKSSSSSRSIDAGKFRMSPMLYSVLVLVIGEARGSMVVR
jgi:hypothetical protein